MRHRFFIAGTLIAGASLVAAAAACAKTVKVPEDKPQVLFDVPDDWAVTSTPLGLDVMPPDRSAMIVAGLIKRDRQATTRWQREATETMKTFGVAFDSTVKKTEKVASPRVPTTVFSGAPSIATPENGPQARTAYEDKAVAGAPLEDLTGRSPPKGAKMPVNALVLFGASYLNTPVDAEFLNFEYSPKELFLMQQESGKTDERIAAILESVRRAN